MEWFDKGERPCVLTCVNLCDGISMCGKGYKYGMFVGGGLLTHVAYGFVKNGALERS